MSYSELTGPINRYTRNTLGFAVSVILLFGAGGISNVYALNPDFMLLQYLTGF